MLENYSDWSGNIDDLRSTAHQIIEEHEIENVAEIYSVRLVRDYVSRGLLGVVERSGKELLFEYEQLLRFIVVRVMLEDGWSLGKIQDQLALSSLTEIEDLLPSENKRAMDTIERLRAAVRSESSLSARSERLSPPVSMSDPMMDVEASYSSQPKFSVSERLSRRARESSSIQREMREALNKLNIPSDGPPMEDLKLIALAPWCQVLLTDERFQKLTVQEARDLGDALTASLTAKILKRGGRR
jgi:DNA-binding transcriptional MerR regulator